MELLDIKWIRQNEELVQRTAYEKGIMISIADLLKCDNLRRNLQNQLEQHRQERNRLNAKIKLMINSNEHTELAALMERAKDVNSHIAELEGEHRITEQEYERLMLYVPNIVSPDTPVGRSDQDNVELRVAGDKTVFTFEPKDHIALGELHGIIDIPRGVKTAGTRNYYLKGAGVALQRAVQQLAIDLLGRNGFTLLEVPLMVRTEALMNTGFFPLGENQTYKIDNEDKWLVGTSEVPLVAYYSNEVIDVTEPVKLAAISQCFRNEVGSAGKDVHGLYRVHQFSKVEQVILCEASLDRSEQLLQEITANAEELLQLLELPYRVMAVCTGDMSQKTYKQMDIETWMPSRGAYGETHSSSNLLDFQARRANIKYRDSNGKLNYCYTLNNTAVAAPRILIPLLENHQEEDGSIRIPAALRPYMDGRERLMP